MTDLVDKDSVCVVVIVCKTSFHVFGVYESEKLAEIRVQDHKKLGLIKDDDIVMYNTEIVWGAKYEE